MSVKKIKRIVFYPTLSSGHMNVSVTISKLLLNNFPDQVDLTFVVNDVWAANLAKYDSRFKFEIYTITQTNYQEFVNEFLEKLEPVTKLPLVERMAGIWGNFKAEKDLMVNVEKQCMKIFEKLKPDLILMDQHLILPSVIKANVPYAFVISTNPVIFDLSEDYPALGSDAGSNEPDKIHEFRKAYDPHRLSFAEHVKELYKMSGVELDSNLVPHKPLSKYFNIYSFPKELDYYSDAVKNEYNLISIDTPLIPERLSKKPFELPDHFKGEKIVYISLGSLYSLYVNLVQRLVDILAKLPYKYIVSKGANGSKLVFPSKNFIGEDYVDQLAVLQVCDAMISHGECFYFGVPCVILPVFIDQINNGKRIEETGFGFTFPIHDYTDDQLIDSVEKLLHDETIKMKWKQASERIQKEANHDEVAKYIFDHA